MKWRGQRCHYSVKYQWQPSVYTIVITCLTTLFKYRIAVIDMHLRYALPMSKKKQLFFATRNKIGIKNK